MKLYGRLLWVLGRALLDGRSDIADPLNAELVTRWRVLPNDVDLYGHMNNGRYAMMMDLARVDFAARMGMIPTLVKERWQMPVGATYLDFRGSLRPFERYEIRTKLLHWDDRWFYFQQQFRRAGAPHEIVATGYVKAIVRGPAGICDTAQVFERLGRPQVRPPTPAIVQRRFGLATPTTGDHEPIAIVGIGCRLPGGAQTPAEYWRLLLDGTDCIVDVPRDRWDPQKFHDPNPATPGRTAVNRAGMLTHDLRGFDPAFFGISPREAEAMDPQLRMVLECSWEALEDGAVVPSRLAGSRTGVFVGGFMMDMAMLRASPLNRSTISTHTSVSSTLTMLSNRLSYFYDLRGPSFSLDTACSSSLVAVHEACQSIWAGESSAALVGGVNLLLVPSSQIGLSKGKFLSPQGRCHTFDRRADGYVRGEGAVIVVLKPLSAALADGNPIYATIRGTAVNQDGKTPGITVPSGEAQVEVMRTAFRQAGIEPRRAAFVEAHGTGTAAGDPVEAKALGQVFGEGRDPAEPCIVASVKTNIGHLEAASGVAGLAKVALCLAHRKVPPHLHLQEVNPDIDLAALKLRVPQQVEALPGDRSLFAGINSFGYGGTNAHVVLASPPQRDRGAARPANDRRPVALVLSARDRRARADLATGYAERLEAEPRAWREIACAAATRREHLRERAFVQGDSAAALVAALRGIAAEELRGPDRAAGTAASEPSCVFVYTGMGPQWFAMGRELYADEPVYRAAVDECDALFRPIANWSIARALLEDEASSRITSTEVAQPANLVVQVGLTRLLASWGLQPRAVMGHSIGEVGAAWASGGLSLREALFVAYHRSRLQQRTAGQGGMLAVGLGPDEARELVDGEGDDVSIAAINSPQAVTLAGRLPALERIAAELTRRERFNKFLRVEVPYHSPVMDQIRADLLDALGALQPRAPSKPIYSTVTGQPMDATRHDAEYWWNNVRQPVAFSPTVARAAADGHDVFVEIGPHPVLASSIRESLLACGRRAEVVATLVRQQPELAAMGQTVGRLYAVGMEPDWTAYLGSGPAVDLPRYPWQRQIHWLESAASLRDRLPCDRHPMVVREETQPTRTFTVALNAAALPFVQDHVVAGSVMFPGAGYVELGLAMARAERGDEGFVTLEGLEFESPVPIPEGDASNLVCRYEPDEGGLRFFHERGDTDSAACARLKIFGGARRPTALGEGLRAPDHAEPVEAADLYEALARKGLQYGPSFRAVTSLRRCKGTTWATIELPASVSAEDYHLHPVLLDAALHSLIAADDADDEGHDVVPAGIDRLAVFDRPGRRVLAIGRIRIREARRIVGDLSLVDEGGHVVAELTGLRCRILPRTTASPVERVGRYAYARSFVPVDRQDPGAIEGPIVTVGAVDIGLPRWIEGSDERPTVVDLRWWADAGPGIDDALAASTRAVAEFIATINRIPAAGVRRYVVVTRGAEATRDDEAPELGLAPLLGALRTAMSERPDLRITWLDCDVLPDDVASVLAEFGDEQEVALRDGQLRAPRIDRVTLEAPTPRRVERPAADLDPDLDSYEVEQRVPGKLDSVGFRRGRRVPPGPGQVEIAIEVYSLHFKDVMKVLGLVSDRMLDGTFAGHDLGMEGAGTITAVGPGVEEFAVGDRVYVIESNMRAHVTVSTERVIRLADGIPCAQGAHLATYLTMYHGLVEVARLRPGERVLIHSATGGVGTAAIEIARYCGAEIIATAGNEDKRAFLRARGIEHVSDSRSLEFVDDVRRWTEGRGVDVVVNFTPGEIMTKSLDCLAPFGRFVELGKVSIDRDEALRLRPFNDNLTFAAVDFDRIVRSRPEYVKAIAAKVVEHLARGDFELPPTTVYPASRLADALREMARGHHRGKLGVLMRDPELVVRCPDEERRFSADATYLVTGGLGGFGLRIARWLADEGARHLALVSRRGEPDAAAQPIIAAMRADGVSVRCFAADVSDRASIDRAFEEIERSMPALRGIVHAATVLDDRPLAEMDHDAIARVMAAKAGGAWLLHERTKHRPLDFMVLCSSISSLIGNAGQANYVAANNLLDQLAHHRKGLGLPVTTINWGVLGEVGLVARDRHTAEHLQRLGLRGLSTADALTALGLAIDLELPQLAIADVQWPRLLEHLPPTAAGRRFDRLREAAPDDDGSAGQAVIVTRFGGLDDSTRVTEIGGVLRQVVAAVMQVSPDTIELERPLRDLGLDSIMALEIAGGIEREIGVQVPIMEVASGPSVQTLAEALAAKVRVVLERAA